MTLASRDLPALRPAMHHASLACVVGGFSRFVQLR
jgi:hypothetical protein